MVPFFPFDFGVSLLDLNSRKKVYTLISMGLLGNLALVDIAFPHCSGGDE